MFGILPVMGKTDHSGRESKKINLTGAISGSPPAEEKEVLGRAEEILTFGGNTGLSGWSDGDENTISTSFANEMTSFLTISQDLLIHGVEIWSLASLRSMEPAVDEPDDQINPLHGTSWQLGTRNGYAEQGDDDTLPAGVMYNWFDFFQQGVSFEDETNGTGGLTGWKQLANYHYVPAELLTIKSTRTVDEGTQVFINFRLHASTIEQGDFIALAKLYVSEREEQTVSI